jgi:hypothetical protein
MPLAVLLALLSTLVFAMPALAQDAPGEEPPVSEESEASGMDEAAAMAAQMRQMQKMLDAQLAKVTDPAQLEQMLAAIEAQAAQLPPEARPMLDVVRKKIEARMAALQAAGDAVKPDEGDAEPQEPVVTPEAQESLDTFMHAALIGRPDLVKSALDRLLADEVSARSLADMVDRPGLGDRFDRAAEACGSMEGVAQASRTLATKLEAGRLELARDPARLKQAVAGLTGTLRQQSIAMRRLEAAGAFAVPPLLRAMVDGTDPRLELMAERTILQIGRSAVVPLCDALPSLPSARQVTVCRMLGSIGNRLAAPWLASLAAAPSTTPDVRQAAQQALTQVGAASADPAPLWTSLARDYLVGGDGLLPYPSESRQAMWSFDPDHGLMPSVTGSDAYLDRMAQRCAVEAMKLDAQNSVALSVYLAAGLRLAGDDPSRAPSGVLSPAALVMAAGPGVAQQVLALAQEIRDPGLQISAIRVLGSTAGASTLAVADGGPLAVALDSTNRLVRIEAALTWASAMPTTSFRRADSVVPVLAAALRLGGRPSAAVLAEQDEDRRVFEAWLTQAGYEVLGSDSAVTTLRTSLAGRGTPDVVVIAGGSSTLNNQSRAMRADALTSGSLLLLAVSETDRPQIDRSLRDDRSVNLWTQGGEPSTFAGALAVLAQRAGGGETGGERSEQLAMQAAAALTRIGQSGGGVFRMADGELDLASALKSPSGPLRAAAAEVLSWVPTPSAQRTLLSAGLDATEPAEQAILLQAAAASARRFGDRADPGQVERLRSLMTGAPGPAADAAAQCYGALNLGPQESIKLIVK